MSEQNERDEHFDGWPHQCPVTGLPYFMDLLLDDELVPTYGGPFDSYTIPVKDESDGTWIRDRYCHDRGQWMGPETYYTDEEDES